MHDSHIHFFQHLQVEEYDLTFAACSFEAILNQAMARLGPYEWQFAGPTATTHGFQERVLVTRVLASPRLLLTVVGRPCAQSCEARESALVSMLLYITDGLAYEINDLHYNIYMMQRGPNL
jgi:hypothetical protein